MHSTLKPKPIDDPHDILVVAPDVVQVAPDEEISSLLREAARLHSGQQVPTASDLPAAPLVRPVDTTFRPASVSNVPLVGQRRSIGSQAVRAFTALLLTVCMGVAAVAWQSDVAKKKIAKWTTQMVLALSVPPDKPGLSAQPGAPAVQADATNAASPQPASSAQAAPESLAPAAVAASSDSAQLLQSTARDLASVRQEVEQLKASIEQLKASQQQMSRDVAKASENKVSENKASEQATRPRTSALPPRPAPVRARKPITPYPPTQAAVAPALPPAAAPYYAPRQPQSQPQIAAEPQAEAELASVPRPPMPLR